MAGYSFSPSLILAAFLAVVQVVLTIVPGVYYARRGVVTAPTRRSLSAVSWGLLLPAMAFYNIVSQVTAGSIASVWPFAANAVVGNAAGILLGWAGAAAIRAPRHVCPAILACAGFGNLNSLPLLVVQAVCHQDAMPFAAALGAQCSSVGFGYVALGSAAMQIVCFPFADWLLARKTSPPAAAAAVQDDSEPDATGHSSCSAGSAKRSAAADGGSGSADRFDVIVLAGSATLPPLQAAPALPAATAAPPPPQQDGEQPAPAPRPGWRRAAAFVRCFYLQPACLVPALALGVACIGPIRSLLVPQQSAPLGFLMGSLNSIQMALLWATSFILGAVLCKGPGPGGRDLGGWRPSALLLAIRFALLPLLGGVVVLGSHALGWWASPDPVFAFVLLMQWSVPTANQMQNLASMHGSGEAAVGTLIFWQWVAALVAVPAWMTAYLWAMGWQGLM